MCGATQRDADGAFYNELLRGSLGAPALSPPGAGEQGRAAEAEAALGAATGAALARAGLRVFAGGVGHAEARAAGLTGDDDGSDDVLA